ncbi:ribonuclease Z [Marchantia polymorpha subsp. ruderalis]|uniref:Metallo-beta-lactamase domain-containing protein n=2 Tax=Marchantia polymorpha TaxID=3197 RepID=A0AAF6BA94_MARPO|nr:hypothetical protein MARPO_0054s0029 [Marchantia polymorpha]BBN08928.1 hypothetical protein Mp_4g15640 [Marchantia polymorpha subsp. ruderalis]|eukprot:PTQ37914.1 hypothetical protein MARPO_0054s0029 [Marchantia polymorpha]
MAMRGLKLWQKLGLTEKLNSSTLSGAYHEFGAICHSFRSLCSVAAAQSSSECSARGYRNSDSIKLRSFSSRKENYGAGTEDVRNSKYKRPSGQEQLTFTGTKGKVARDEADLSTSGPEKISSSSRRKEKPSVYTTSDYVDYRGMQLVFLGTSSSIPTLKRNTSCIALRLEGSIFLFDCGEGAVRQILKTPMKHYDIGHIFLTHMHGDHIFGLPGLLCRLGLKEFQNKEPIQIYGPQGLRQWIRTTLKASHARVHPKYVVHELHLRKKSTNVAHSWNYVDANHEDELPGRDIQRSEDGLWQVLNDSKYVVRASFLRHSIPCWGYVVEERTRRGRFDVERARQHGVKPGKFFRMLEAGDSVMLADGNIVYPSDVLGTPRRGRKVVILGDTCDSKSMMAAAQEADVVVHEATVLEQDASEVLQRGHSTARMAGQFARDIKAGTLVLTHFSRKLDGALYVDERSQTRETIGHLVASAQEAFEKDNVIAAEDMMAITIELEDKAPLKDSQHLRPSSESEEAKNPQRKVGRHSTSSDLDDSSSRKDVLGGQSVPSQLEKKASRSSVRRPSSTSEVDQKPFNRSARSRHLSPAQLTDKTVFKNLQKRRASRPPRSSFLSE